MFNCCGLCGTSITSITNGDYICYNCGHTGNVLFEVNNSYIAPEQVLLIPKTNDTLKEIADHIKENEQPLNNIDTKYTLVYNSKDDYYDSQMTYLIDTENKTYYKFYSDGYQGENIDHVKSILNFLGIKYFECVYSNRDIIHDKYDKEYTRVNGYR